MEEPRYFDIRHVAGESTHIEIDNGVVETAATGFMDRAVIRALGKTGWGVVIVDNFSAKKSPEVRSCIDRALRLSGATEERVELADADHRILPVPAPREDPQDVSLEEKVHLLVGIENAARIPGISNTRARYVEEISTVTFLSSDSVEYSFRLPRCGFSVVAVAESGGILQMGRESQYTIRGLNLRHQESLGRTAAERAALLLDARPAKGGTIPAILDPELAGVFAHEAIGHASEGDIVKEGGSVVGGKMGEQIASRIVTIVDDPSLPEFGFEPVDAEGVGVGRCEIIREGRLVSFLHNRQTLAAVGDGEAGHARAVAGDPPLVRMSNTFIENGDADLDELLRECGEGILLAGSRGGQVDPGRGIFLFNAEYGYLVEGGELGPMVRDVSLSGDILSTLHAITLVAGDRKMHQGFCGKGGQGVPVSDGSPHLLLSQAMVGGRDA
ncbi:MAG: TldD/PmbA family protein [Methanomicrobiaceae archaeon]|nr:TldD/PmbA family protein [Methanomicrobiaceae archaeon]